jgi:excisionase family DNA binding protein
MKRRSDGNFLETTARAKAATAAFVRLATAQACGINRDRGDARHAPRGHGKEGVVGSSPTEGFSRISRDVVDEFGLVDIGLSVHIPSIILASVPDDYLPLDEAAKRLGRARQTVLHKVQRGELRAVQVINGRRKGLRIQVSKPTVGLFDQ